MDQFSGGNWSMIPNVQAQGSFVTPTNQDHLFLQQQQPQQFHHQQQQQQTQQQQFQPQQQQQQQQEMQFQQFQQQQFIQQQQFHHQQHRLLHSPNQHQPQSSLQSPPPQQTVVHTPQSMMHTPQQQQQLVHTPQQSVQTPQQHQSLASHFHLYPLVEKLADAVETGTRDQNSDALVSELNGHFDKCQQLLNSISGSLGSKTTMTVDGQKRNLEESEQLLQQRRDLIMEYRKSIEDLVKIEP
ncbi:Mediator of RNA polymerase II transcription subunit 9 [Hirschfeldia incana]|nr:Mediator of RNA polymerase II transcription subunit 9 [Hirschfeldia incana]KAJ0249921.1 Mediator of RNA polymerase II transcription subunit 9 [Hirschfeldia incana]